jgi:cytochrome P450
MALPDRLVGTVVTGFDEIREVLTDERFAAMRTQLRSDDVRPPQYSPGLFIMMDAPEHTRFRRMLAGHFTVRRMRQLQPAIERFTAEHLDAMARTGGPVDLVTEFALPIPSLAICELLGVPYADHAMFQHNSSLMTSTTTTRAATQVANRELTSYLRGLVEAKRADPTPDLLSELANAGELTDEELLGVGLLVLVAGHESTANMIALGVMCLLANPGELARLRARPELIGGAVEELLRYLTILQFGIRRTAREDVDLHGIHIPAGSTVIAALSAGNRSDAHFAGDPDVLDLARQYSPHLAFGHGIHQCLGQQLARIELEVAYTALFDRFPDLRLGQPLADIPMRDESVTYGPRELLVSW